LLIAFYAAIKDFIEKLSFSRSLINSCSSLELRMLKGGKTFL